MWKKKADDRFFEELCAANYENVLRYLYRALGEETIARDTVQEVFLTACAKKALLMQHPNPGGWLFQTAKNLVKKAKREAFSRMMEEPLPEEGEGSLPDQGSTIERMLDQEIDESQYIAKVLSELSMEKLELYTRHYLKGQTMREIALSMGADEAAIRMRYVRLRREIKEIASQVAEKSFGI